LYVAEIKTGFADNDDCFPDWKTGDPVPESEVQQESDGRVLA